MKIRDLLREVGEPTSKLDSEPDTRAKTPDLGAQPDPGGPPGGPPDAVPETPPAPGDDRPAAWAIDAPSGDDAPEDEAVARRMSSKAIASVANHDFITKFSHADDPAGSPGEITAMDDGALKDAYAKAVKEKRQIELVADAGLYDDERYNRLKAKIDFIKRIAGAR